MMSSFALHFGPAIRFDGTGACGEDSPEFLTHEAGNRGALVQAVIIGNGFEHRQIALSRRERSHLRLLHRHLSLAYKFYIRFIYRQIITVKAEWSERYGYNRE